MRVRSTVDHPLLMFTPDGVYEVRPREEFEVPDGSELPPQIEAVKIAKPKATKDGDA